MPIPSSLNVTKMEDLHVTEIILGIGKINSCHVCVECGQISEWCLFIMEFPNGDFISVIHVHVITTTLTKIEFVGELILVVK